MVAGCCSPRAPRSTGAARPAAARAGSRAIGYRMHARCAYASSKMYGEVLAQSCVRELGSEMVVSRLFNVVGPRQRAAYGMVLPRFVDQAMRGAELTVFGNGAQSRCFLHIADAVPALIALTECDAAIGGIYNVGSPKPVRIVDLAQLVIKRTGSSSGVRYVPFDVAYEPGFEDLDHRVPDTTAVEGAIQWEPSARSGGGRRHTQCGRRTEELATAAIGRCRLRRKRFWPLPLRLPSWALVTRRWPAWRRARDPRSAGRLQAARARHGLPRRGRDPARPRGRITSARGCRQPDPGDPRRRALMWPLGTSTTTARFRGDARRRPGRHRGGVWALGAGWETTAPAWSELFLTIVWWSWRPTPSTSSTTSTARRPASAPPPPSAWSGSRSPVGVMGRDPGRRPARRLHRLPALQPRAARADLPRRRRRQPARLRDRGDRDGRVRVAGPR